MSTARKVAKNAAFVFLGSNIFKVASMVLIFFIARYLGAADYGKFSFVLSFTGLFFIFMDLGTRMLIVREVAQNKDNAAKIVSNLLILKTMTSALVYALIIAVSILLGYEMSLVYAIAIAALGIVFESFATTLGSVCTAYERMELPQIARMIRVIVRLAITLPVLFAGYGFMAVLAAYVFVQFLNFIVAL